MKKVEVRIIELRKGYGVSDEDIKRAQNEILKRPEGDAHLCQTFYKIRVPGLSKGKKRRISVLVFLL